MGSSASIPTSSSTLATLTAVQVADMVAGCGEEFSRYRQVFLEKHLDGHVLSHLHTPDDVLALLCTLGITDSEHQSTLSYRLMQAQGIARHTSVVGVPSLTVVNEQELTELSAQGEHVEAMVLCERTMLHHEKRLGMDHPDTLNSVFDLACLLDQQGHYDRAKDMYHRILSVKIPSTKQPKEVDDVLCIHTLHNLATLLYKQYLRDGHAEEVVQEAQELFECVLRSQSSTLGHEHPTTLTTLQDLALLFQHRHRYEQAQEMWERLLRGQESSLGKLDVATLGTLHRMATMLNEQGRYNEAKTMYQRLLRRREKTLGWSHIDTLHTTNDLAQLLCTLKEYTDAKEMYIRVLGGYETTVGYDHTDTLKVVMNLAAVMYKLGILDEAKTLYERVLQGHETRLTEQNSSTSNSNSNSNTPFMEKNSLDDPSVVIVDDLDILDVINNLSNVLYRLGQLEGAKKLWERALRGYESLLGVYHQDTLRTMGNLANVLNAQGEYDEAIVVYTRILETKEQTLGREDMDTLATAHDLAGLLSEQDRDEEALVLFERVLHGYEPLTANIDYTPSTEPHKNGSGSDVIGNSNVNGITNDTEAHTSSLSHLTAMVNVAVTWKKLGIHLDQAREMFERALRGYEHTPSIG